MMIADEPQILAAPEGVQLPEKLITSKSDTRESKTIVLENGLTVLLVSDPTSSKAAAAMQVRVGSAHNPPGLEGLAHFLEHMLFMGTTKYPDEDEYNKYLTENAGGSNAFTTNIATNYFFFCQPSAFHGALDRFAQFFICPLFTESAVERELNAVNSEHTRNIPNDAWALNNINRILGNPAHPDNRFHTGSLQTLRDIPKQNGVDVVQALKDFHAKYYSANISTLAIVSHDSLDASEAMVREFFTPVVNKNVVLPQPHKQFPNTPIEHEEDKQGAFVCYRPTNKYDVLSIEIPFFVDSDKEGLVGAHKLLSNILGDESAGSIAYILKNKGLATFVYSFKNYCYYKNSIVLMVGLTPTGCTDEGLAEITSVVLHGASLLANEVIPTPLAKEQLLMQRISFHNTAPKEADHVAVEYAENLSIYPAALALCGDNLSMVPGMQGNVDTIEISDEVAATYAKCASNALASAFQAGMCVTFNISKQSFTDEMLDLVDIDYNKKYALVRNADHPLAALKNKLQSIQKDTIHNPDGAAVVKKAKEELNLGYPSQNEFIPQSFDLKKPFCKRKVEADDPACFLKEMSNNCSCRCRGFILEDEVFGEPRAQIELRMYVNGFFSNPETGKLYEGEEFVKRSYALDFLVETINAILTETITEMSTKADLRFSFSFITSTRCLRFKLSGFNDKMGHLMDKVSSVIGTFKLDEGTHLFNSYQLTLQRLQSLVTSASSMFQYSFCADSFNLSYRSENIAASLELCKNIVGDKEDEEAVKAVMDFVNGYFPNGFADLYCDGYKGVHCDVLAAGNVTDAEVSGWADKFLDNLKTPKASSIPSDKMVSNAGLFLWNDQLTRVRLPNTNATDKNDLLVLSLTLNEPLGENETAADIDRKEGRQFFGRNIDLCAKIAVLHSIMDQTFFDDIRSKQNLGYSVRVAPNFNLRCLRFLVETSKTTSEVALARVLEFMDNLWDETREYNRNKQWAFSEDNFNVAKEATLASELRLSPVLSNFMSTFDWPMKNRMFDAEFRDFGAHLCEATRNLDYRSFFQFLEKNFGRTLAEKRGFCFEIVKSEEHMNGVKLALASPSEEDLRNEHSLVHPQRIEKDKKYLDIISKIPVLVNAADDKEAREKFNNEDFVKEAFAKMGERSLKRNQTVMDQSAFGVDVQNRRCIGSFLCC